MPELIPAAPGSPNWTTPDGAHRLEIEPRASRRYAVCSCGYRGPSRPNLAGASKDGMAHLAAMTHA